MRSTRFAALLLAPFILLILVGTARAQSADDLAKLCDRGDADGCYRLGVMYRTGKGASQDNVKAFELYAKACDRGEMKGCSNMGVQHLKGEGVRQDKARAFALFAKACDGGLPGACSNLGGMYERGDGIQQDRSKAVVLYSSACDRGFEHGCSNLRRLNAQQVESRKGSIETTGPSAQWNFLIGLCLTNPSEARFNCDMQRAKRESSERFISFTTFDASTMTIQTLPTDAHWHAVVVKGKCTACIENFNAISKPVNVPITYTRMQSPNQITGSSTAYGGCRVSSVYEKVADGILVTTLPATGSCDEVQSGSTKLQIQKGPKKMSATKVR